jgi:hypothetical protein
MSTLNEPIAKRIGKFVRMLSSPYADRQVALTKLENLLKEEGLSFNDIATVIENCNGEIEQLKYSDSDMAKVAEHMKERGLQEGYQKAKAENSLPPQFYDVDGEPRWYEIALYIETRKGRLNDWERGFVEGDPQRGSLVANMAKFGKPTPKQTKHVLGIFIKLGGMVPPEVIRQYR